MKHLKLLPFLFLALFVASCNPDDPEDVKVEHPQVAAFDYKIINDWNDAFLEIERYADGYRPGPAPRGLAYLGLSAYEGCVSGMPKYKSLSGVWPGFNIPAADPSLEYNWPIVINESYNYLMQLFFVKASEQMKTLIATKYSNNLNAYSVNVPKDVVDRSKARGLEVATLIWEWAKTDAVGHDHYLDPFQGYNWQDHFVKDGDWVPTTPGPGKPMGGVWGNARAFSLKTPAELVCAPPIPYSENTQSEFFSQALEVYAQNTPTLSADKEWVGEYWSDDLVGLTFSPGPRWMAIGMQVLDLNESNLEEAVVMAAKIGIALNDASVACWKSKYVYNLERPESYIKRVIDDKWEPALNNPMNGDVGFTPSFPAYPSGHSTMGGAGAEILASMFGYSYGMTDNCHRYRTEFAGAPRTFPSFHAMAEENAWSRVPLGTHFRMDCTVGVNFGYEIGRKVNALPWKK